MKINKIAGLLLYAGSLFIYSSTVECSTRSAVECRSWWNVFWGTPSGDGLNWAEHLAVGQTGIYPNGIYPVFTQPRVAIAYSPIASIATAALIGGLAVHYDVPSKILALTPEPIREGIKKISPDTAEKLTVAACALLYAYVCRPSYWGVVQGCWNRVCGRAYDNPVYHPLSRSAW